MNLCSLDIYLSLWCAFLLLFLHLCHGKICLMLSLIVYSLFHHHEIDLFSSTCVHAWANRHVRLSHQTFYSLVSNIMRRQSSGSHICWHVSLLFRENSNCVDQLIWLNGDVLCVDTDSCTIKKKRKRRVSSLHRRVSNLIIFVCPTRGVPVSSKMIVWCAK